MNKVAVSNDSESFLHEFGRACAQVHSMLEQAPPSVFRTKSNECDPFMLRMAAAGYKALAAEFESRAKDVE